jgi:hypothetical protein
VIKRVKSNLPYFVHYDKFIEEGTNTLVLLGDKTAIKQVFVVKDAVSPYKR